MNNHSNIIYKIEVIGLDKCFLTLKYIIINKIDCLNEAKINFYYTWRKKGVNKGISAAFGLEQRKKESLTLKTLK